MMLVELEAKRDGAAKGPEDRGQARRGGHRARNRGQARRGDRARSRRPGRG